MTKLKIRIFIRIKSYETLPLRKPDHWCENLISDLSRACTDFTYVKKNNISNYAAQLYSYVV